MDPALIDELFEDLCQKLGLDGARRESVRVWVLSGVERVRLPDNSTLIFKHAVAPFTAEARVLRHVGDGGIPVPGVVAAVERPDSLGMFIDDLGPALREPTINEGAAAAVAAHNTPPLADLPVLDQHTLAGLPASCLATLDQLTASGRWADTTDVADTLRDLHEIAADRSEGAGIAPYGLCHSEFHPTSVHIAESGWHILDWARSFCGPGLLDLASWQNTTEAPDFAAFRELVDAYIAAGGSPDATAERGSLPAERWAYGWHRLWVIDWFLQQCATWIADPDLDPTYQKVIRRHLAEAVTCLGTTSARSTQV